ncbi:MAG: flagellar hook-basal body complex protein FliE [Phyllobacteriaceae bacterium]|nr:flagellar hook-basal body complex protein FliE [Phyllobacteriaceae bacterium]
MTPSALAAGAYRATQALTNRAEPRQIAEVGTGGPSFGDMLKQAVGDVSSQGRAMEDKALAYAGGKADVVDVVTAVAETQATFETVVALRDKVISAYEEIMKMPI